MKSLKILLLLLLALAGPVAVLLASRPFPQPLWYHDFADQRCLLCVPHALNVVSNLPFVLVGGWGVAHLLSRRDHPGFREPSERWPYVVFFAAIALTGVGSAYYHWRPNNPRLVWDRLPLAVAFMALFATVLAERIAPRFPMRLLVPLTLLGAGSVLYWHFTEAEGRGDLRPYLIVQFYPLVLLPLVLLLFPARYSRTADLVGALAWYALAKLLEALDRVIYSQGQVVSGHTLKHLIAAVSALLILHMIRHRRPLPAPAAAPASAPKGTPDGASACA